MKNKKKNIPSLEKQRNKYDICSLRSCPHFIFMFNKELTSVGCEINKNPQTCKKNIQINEILDNI